MNILIITPYFPTFDIFRTRSEDPRTKFLFDYAVEWEKIGHRVLVIHTIPKYPATYPWFVRFVEFIPGGNRLQLRRFVQNQATVRPADFIHKGIHIIRIPVPKFIPHRDYFNTHKAKLNRQVKTAVQSTGWVPDLILSDFLSPSLSVACHIKGHTSVPVVQIFHQSDLRYFKSKKSFTLELLKNTCCYLFRSPSMKQEFEKCGCNVKRYRYMFSGVPNWVKLGDCRYMVTKFLYVGALRHSKNVHRIIQAFAMSSLDDCCKLEIIGSGPDEKELKKLTETLGIESRVTFHGRISREEVFDRMRESDCLIMVSKETFGMVYIEAMSQGCIVVAAKGQGIDGIVVDGENGFLVPLNDARALSKIMYKLNRLKEYEVCKISKSAIATGAMMKDDVLAYNLLEELKFYTETVR